MELPKRKNMRLKDYDYRQNGAYFVTICVKDKCEMLWQSVGANCVRPLLSDVGDVVNREIIGIPDKYSNVNIDKYAIMPNHVHMIVVLRGTCGRTLFAPTLSRIIKQFKGSITKQTGFSLWQKSFHDRIIRNETEYRKIWQYVDTNPQKWTDDCYFAV